MLKTQIILSLRNLFRGKTFTLINILGLGSGIAAALLIYEYVSYERSFDRFHTKGAQIFRVVTEWNKDITPNDKRATTVAWSGPGIKGAFPEVEEFARFTALDVFTGANTVMYKEKELDEQKIFLADPGFLRMFDFRLLQGDPETALNDPSSIVITSSIAAKYFADEDPMGKFLYINDHDNISENKSDLYQVTGVIADPPKNSHMTFDFLLSYHIIFPGLHSGSTYWHWDYTYCYLLLHPGASIADLEQKISDIRLKEFGEEMIYYSDRIDFKLQPLHDIHLKSSLSAELSTNHDGRAVELLIIIGLCILLSAYINYVNLSTVKAHERQKEIGVRKLMGSSRRQLASQMIIESVILNVVAFIVGLGLYALSKPMLENFFNMEWNEIPLLSFETTGAMIAMVSCAVVISVIYPTIVLTRFKPVTVLKNHAVAKIGKSQISFRSFLVVLQFTFCVAFTIATYAMYSQMQFMKDHDKGMNTEQVMTIKGFGFQSYSVYESLKTRLTGFPVVASVGISSAAPGEEINELNFNRDVSLVSNPSITKKIKMAFADDGFFEALDIRFIAGAPFSGSEHIDDQIVLNEAAARLLGFSDSGKILHEWVEGLNERPMRVTAVIRNYHQRSLKNRFDPMIFYPMKGNDFSWNKRYIFVKLDYDPQSGDVATQVEAIKNAWVAVHGERPFQYFFLDRFFDHQTKADQTLSALFIFFAGFAVFISCLGLFGLVAYATLQRTREIGIRKVLGASVHHILVLLSGDFVRLLLIAVAISAPFILYGIRYWLEQYAFRIDITVWLIVIPVGLVLAVSITTVVLRSLSVALTNPVDSIRHD